MFQASSHAQNQIGCPSRPSESAQDTKAGWQTTRWHHLRAARTCLTASSPSLPSITREHIITTATLFFMTLSRRFHMQNVNSGSRMCDNKHGCIRTCMSLVIDRMCQRGKTSTHARTHTYIHRPGVSVKPPLRYISNNNCDRAGCLAGWLDS